ncbi:pilus assembly protein [Salipiger bermudensis]|uniref:TadE/TadG family type IV pilus assembly protein n=1 Tax=Salipiger bermudensis TaxID=344736 RepID=UPI001C99E73D|nr:pilus assembly protein [Salipiger bermudensis]MBY6006553.1 pilus assembly protein [Salipiger bermudensis]
MIARFKKSCRRFCADQDGSGPVEVVLYTTALLVLLGTSVELGIINLKQALLERALAVSVRDVRLNTGASPDYAAIKHRICEEMTASNTCEANMMLEMKVAEPTNFVGLPDIIDCINAEEEPRPSRQFEPGLDNDLMLMRACFKYKPIFPTSRLSASVSMDQNGYAQLVARAMFVQEPR